MRGYLSKKDFKEKYGYSESRYQRRMKNFKFNPDYPNGYVAPSKNEVWIQPDIFDQFLMNESSRKNEYQHVENWSVI